MIDAWLIFTLVIPFMEVILHTKMRMIRQRVKKMEEDIKNTWGENKEQISQSMKKNDKTLRFLWS